MNANLYLLNFRNQIKSDRQPKLSFDNTCSFMSSASVHPVRKESLIRFIFDNWRKSIRANAEHPAKKELPIMFTLCSGCKFIRINPHS